MSQPIQNEAEPPQERGIMILLDLVGSTHQALEGSDTQLREYRRRRIEHVTACAQKYGIERLDDQGDADLLFLPGDSPKALLEFFHDINHRDPVPDYLHFRPVFRLVAHYNRFAFSPRGADGLRKQLPSNYLTLLFRFEKSCPERALLMTRPLYELVCDHVPATWLQCKKPVPPKLEEWLRITAKEMYWLGFPGDDLRRKVEAVLGLADDDLQTKVEATYAKLSEPSTREFQSLVVSSFLDVVLLAVTIVAFWQGMSDNWNPSLLLPISLGLKGMWIMWELPHEVKVIAFMALLAVVSGSTILLGALVAKKESPSGWWTAGWGLLALGGIMAAVLAVMQSRRGGIPPNRN